MDPVSMLLVSIGLAMASDSGGSNDEALPTLWDLFEIGPWHFAMSHDWNSFWVTVRAGDSDQAFREVRSVLEASGGDMADDDDYRFYACIKGGRKIYPEEPNAPERIPEGAVVHVVWQAEHDIEAVTVMLQREMDLDEILSLAWEQVDEDTDIYAYAEESGEIPGPELVVVGGEVFRVWEI